VAAGALTGAASRDVLVCFMVTNGRYGEALRRKAFPVQRKRKTEKQSLRPEDKVKKTKPRRSGVFVRTISAEII
jgi:hypothetical protein